MEQSKKRNKWLKWVLILAAALAVAAALGFFTYVSDYYRADEIAIGVMEDQRGITVEGNLTVLSPEIPGDTALIFYPGAKVEHLAYLPMLEMLREEGITCVLVEMPFHMAIFNPNAADDVFEKFPSVKNWYIGGHSMGGAMASGYASKHKTKVKGLILLGAYVYGDYPPEDALTVYGTFNSNLEKNIDYEENIVIIEGGNHAQFGNYGKQKGDPDAAISGGEQQRIGVEAILAFIKERETGQ